MLNFPKPPTVNVDDLYPDPAIDGVPQWRWDGIRWMPAAPEALLSSDGTTITINQVLTLAGDPVGPLDAATKQYVDNEVEEVAGAGGAWVGTPISYVSPVWTHDGASGFMLTIPVTNYIIGHASLVAGDYDLSFWGDLSVRATLDQTQTTQRYAQLAGSSHFFTTTESTFTDLPPLGSTPIFTIGSGQSANMNAGQLSATTRTPVISPFGRFLFTQPSTVYLIIRCSFQISPPAGGATLSGHFEFHGALDARKFVSAP